jgi:hypothetical protein
MGCLPEKLLPFHARHREERSDVAIQSYLDCFPQRYARSRNDERYFYAEISSNF